MEQPMQNVVEDEEKEIEVEVLSENEEPEIEEAPAVEEPVEVEEVSEEHEQEVAEYSDSVKKRIDKLTYKMREAERRERINGYKNKTIQSRQ